VSTSRGRLVLFAREPVAGQVKSRLAAALGRRPAALLYAAFLEDLARALAPGAWEATVAYDGEPRRLRATFGSGWSFRPQGDGDLGARMTRAASLSFDEGSRAVVLAGSDAPTLTGRDVAAAFDALGRADVVLAPAPDGGFTLAGFRRAADPPRVFAGVRWSTHRTLEDARGAAAVAGCGVELLDPVADVDVVEDLPRLFEALRNDPTLAPATRRALATHDEIPVR
jgi:rSAM/selenodomain-associated transferase 1